MARQVLYGLALALLALALVACPAQARKPKAAGGKGGVGKAPAKKAPAELPIRTYDFTFEPVRCYRARSSCRLVKKSYKSIDKLPNPWPPRDVTPGEYRVTVVAVGADAAQTRIRLKNEVVAFGKPLPVPSPSPPPPRKTKKPPPPARRPGKGGSIGSGGPTELPFTSGSILPKDAVTVCGACGFTPKNVKISSDAFGWLPPFLRFIDPTDMIESFLYQAQRTLCSSFLSGAQIRSGGVPFIPTAMNIVAGWFGPLPLTSSTQYIAGALIAATPVKVTLDSSGATPSMGKGVAFAINPCNEEFHFSFVDIVTPAVRIPPLFIEVSSQPTVLSVANKGTMASDNEAIGMTQPFWVGVGAPLENRVMSRAHLFLAGKIIVAPIGSSNLKVIPSVSGDGKALVSWDPDTSRGGDFELMTQLSVIPELSLFDKMTISFPAPATTLMYMGQTDQYRFRMSVRITPFNINSMVRDWGVVSFLRNIRGMPSFIPDTIAKVFSGSSSDPRCSSLPGFSFPELDVFADSTGSFGIRVYVCMGTGTLGFVGSKILDLLGVKGFPRTLSGDVAFSVGSGNFVAVQFGSFRLHFCKENSHCPSGLYCGVAICLDLGVFKEVIKLATEVIDQVDQATKELYRDSMRAAQSVPGLLDGLGDAAKKVGEKICAETVCNPEFKKGVDKFTSSVVTIVNQVGTVVNQVTKPVVNTVTNTANTVVKTVTNTANKVGNTIKKWFG